MLLEWSNILAVVGVTFTTVVGMKYIVPTLPTSYKAHYIHMMAWGFLYIIGQVAQSCKFGPLWVQYQLCDLCYASWAPTLGISALVVLRKLRHIAISTLDIRLWSIRTFFGFAILGYVIEVWDTLWAWSYDGTLVSAIDRGDYIILTFGAAFAFACYRQLGWPKLTTQLRLAISKS